MSGLEVVAIVASLASAFHGGAELIRRYKKHRAKKREQKRQQHEKELYEQDSEEHEPHEQELHGPQGQDQAVVQDMLHTSLEEGGAMVIRQFRDEQRALGRYSQLLRSGDDRAKQELLMIAVSL